MIEDGQWKFYERLMAQRLSPKRLAHSQRVAQEGLRLSGLYGGDAQKICLAGLLHDGAKELPKPKLWQLAQDHDLVTDPAEAEDPALLHGPVGAWLAKEQWGIRDPMVLEAIRYHTTAAPNLSLEAYIVFMADLIEPGRNFKGVGTLRCLASRDLKQAILEAIDQTFIYLEQKKAPVHQAMRACRCWLEPIKLGSNPPS